MLCKSCYKSIIPTPKLVNGSLFYGIHFFAEWHQAYLYLCLVVNWSLCFSPYLYGHSPPQPWPPLAWRAGGSVSSRGSWAGPGRPRLCRSLSPRPPPLEIFTKMSLGHGRSLALLSCPTGLHLNISIHWTWYWDRHHNHEFECQNRNTIQGNFSFALESPTKLQTLSCN